MRQSHHVAGMIGEIGVTTREQESGVGQVNEAITQLDKVTQQNAALVGASKYGGGRSARSGAASGHADERVPYRSRVALAIQGAAG